MPHVLLAWVRWAGAKSGLADSALAATLEAVFEAMRRFPTVYRDPASFGLEADMVGRLLPDGDLEALARRVFAFPLLRGSYRGINLATLGPSVAADRRTLLAADHEDAGRQHADAAYRVSSEHLDGHLALADRLWRGDPPELWEAAQRLLDLGEDRHEVLHLLIGDDPVGRPAGGRHRRRAGQPAARGARLAVAADERQRPGHRSQLRRRRELRGLAAWR